MKTKKIKIRNLEIRAKVADNFLTRAIGLMFRKKLKRNEGILFIFKKEFFPRFWMMGMRFPLDMIWIDKSKKIVDITKNAKPSFNPFKTYVPRKPCKYVLEVKASLTDEQKIKINDVVTFD